VTCEILAQVANALDSAWNKPSPETGNPLHLVHRDIKPQNIRITIHGRVKLLDFGIARTNEIRRDARTLIGDVVYTPGYVGPEVMAGDSQGPGGDIFALGATIYLALIGEAFFPQDMEVKEQRTVMLFRKKYAAYLDKRLDVIPGPDDLVTLLREMLSYWDTDRPSAREVQTRLMDIADVVGGQSATRWAVDAVFPDPVFCEGASLTGQTIRHESVRVVTESIIPKRREYAQAESFPLRNTGELTAPAQYSPPAEPVDPPSPEVVDAPVASPPSDRLYTLAMIAVGFTVGLGLAVVLSLLG
jgi:serine/threonine protein kinase